MLVGSRGKRQCMEKKIGTFECTSNVKEDREIWDINNCASRAENERCGAAKSVVVNR